MRTLRRKRMLTAPLPSQHPPRMTDDHDRTGTGGLPRQGSVQNLPQAFTATRVIVGKVSHPSVDLLTTDVLPMQAIPSAKARFKQCRVYMVHPPPRAQDAPDQMATLQRRGVNHAFCTMQSDCTPHAVSQSLGLAPVYPNVALTNTTPGHVFGLRVPPCQDDCI